MENNISVITLRKIKNMKLYIVVGFFDVHNVNYKRANVYFIRGICISFYSRLQNY